MALMQLVAYGAPDVFLIARGDAEPCNRRDAMTFWQINQPDGSAQKPDFEENWRVPSMACVGTLGGSTKNKMASRVQDHWRRCVLDPSYRISRISKNPMLKELSRSSELPTKYSVPFDFAECRHQNWAYNEIPLIPKEHDFSTDITAGPDVCEKFVSEKTARG